MLKKALRLQLKRAESYLVLVRNSTPISATVNLLQCPVGTRSFEETGHRTPSSSVQKASDGDSSCDVFIVAVDRESFKFNQYIVTETWISTLDTCDLIWMDSALLGKNWVTKIKFRHFPILKNAQILSKVGLKGCPDDFAYGETEWIERKATASVLHK